MNFVGNIGFKNPIPGGRVKRLQGNHIEAKCTTTSGGPRIKTAIKDPCGGTFGTSLHRGQEKSRLKSLFGTASTVQCCRSLNDSGAELDRPLDCLVGGGMTLPDIDFSGMAAALEDHPNYRVLRRLKYRDSFVDAGDQPTRIGILLDVETTGLDTSSDEVIELGMVKFTYLPSGEIVRVIDTFNSLNEPTKPIPPEVTKLHHITDEMVAGHKIDDDAVELFASDAVVVIAHNAGFDRQFAERYWPTFVEKAWACSVNNIDWREHGFEGSRLGYLLAGVGMFHQAHRAVDDCRALLEMLAFDLPSVGRTALSVLLENARKRTVRIWAQHSPFDLKDELKKRGYRWSAGDDGRPKAWYVDIDESLEADEMRYLSEHIYRRDVDLFTQIITAVERYSVRG